MRKINNFESKKGNTNVKRDLDEPKAAEQGWNSFETYDNESDYVSSGEKANSDEAERRIKAWRLGHNMLVLANMAKTF